MDLVVEGSDRYIDDAIETYKAYNLAIKRLEVRFHLKREAEVVLGRALKWNSQLSADKGSVSKSITSCFAALEKKFRDEFFCDVSSSQEIDMKASAWYQIVYDERYLIGVCELCINTLGDVFAGMWGNNQ